MPQDTFEFLNAQSPGIIRDIIHMRCVTYCAHRLILFTQQFYEPNLVSVF